ncbi:TPA: hypothetical protein REU56_002931 [Listeria monocytogenes]|nr:hypothetical protein [Listeria monocytogenes]
MDKDIINAKTIEKLALKVADLTASLAVSESKVEYYGEMIRQKETEMAEVLKMLQEKKDDENVRNTGVEKAL